MAGAGRNRAARGGFPVRRGWEAVPVVLSEVATAAGNAPGPHRGGVNSGCAGGDYDGCRWGSVPVVLPGVATAAGNAPGARQGRGEPWREGRGSGCGGGWLLAGMGRASQLCSQGSPLRLGTPISSAPGSPRIAIPWVQRRAADHW